MKLRETFDKKTYTSTNAQIVRIDIGLVFKVTVEIGICGSIGEGVVNLFVTGDCIKSFCSLVGVDDLMDALGKYVRVLHIDEHPEFRMMGFAHIIRDDAMIFSDYKRHGVPVEPKEGEEIFTMASIDPPPGLPWRLTRTSTGAVCLFPASGDIPLAQYVEPELEDWLVTKAKLAETKYE